MNIFLSFVLQVSMMSEGSAHIKQELDISCCSPSPSSVNNSSNNNNNTQFVMYNVPEKVRIGIAVE